MDKESENWLLVLDDTLNFWFWVWVFLFVFCFLEYVPQGRTQDLAAQTSSISLIWELDRNAKSQPHPRFTALNSAFYHEPQVMHVHIKT